MRAVAASANCTVPAVVMSVSTLMEASYLSIVPPTRNVVAAEGDGWTFPGDVTKSFCPGGDDACLEFATLDASAADNSSTGNGFLMMNVSPGHDRWVSLQGACRCPRGTTIRKRQDFT